MVRRWLSRVGPTWLSSPVRRAIQAICFVAFLVLFFYVCWPYTARPNATSEPWPSHYANDLARKEKISAEFFLVIDPLVSLSTALASRAWVWSLTSAGIILLVCVFIPRGFCGYLCPLGTLIDLFDWAIGSRVKRFRVGDNGWWVHVKYYVLLATLVAAACGVLISGFVAAIPVLTRGLLFAISPWQTGFQRGWHLVPPVNAGHFVSLALFAAVLGLGLLKPRFWCRYVCPSGAVFSLGNLFRVTERKVENTCINCNKCVEICPFDAIKPDFLTRTTDCTLCQSCGGVCPTQAIKFVERWNLVQLKLPNDPPTGDGPLGRRGFLAAGIGLASGVLGGLGLAVVGKASGANLDDPNAWRPVRPPGSVPEEKTLADVHPLRRVFQGLSERRAAPVAFLAGTRRPVDSARRRRLGRLRIELQCLRPSLSDGSDPSLAFGRTKGLSHRARRSEFANLPAVCRPRGVSALRR